MADFPSTTSAYGRWNLADQRDAVMGNNWPKLITYEVLTFTANNGNVTITNNGTDSVSVFKTAGSSAWDTKAYVATPYTAPFTVEYTKQAGASDNGVSYAMISLNTDPTANNSYTSLDYASYPFNQSNYQVYNNGSLVLNTGTWNPANRFYYVYDSDGNVKHYNGSTLLYSVNAGTGRTVYVDIALYSVNATFGGFSNVKAIKQVWNGTAYV